MMVFRSLKTKLVLTVSALVIAGGISLSFLVSSQYGDSLRDSAQAQAENMAHALALESVDKILTHDLVALQKSLDHQAASNPVLGYLFVVRDGAILAHTFPTGVPIGLLDVNRPLSPDEGNVVKVAGMGGEKFIDIAWPIFSGSAGTLRLGFSEKQLETRVRNLRFTMTLLTLAILLGGVAATILLVRRITKPLQDLSNAARKIEKGSWDIDVSVSGKDEVATLAQSFVTMTTRLKEYTEQLESQKNELQRLHNQTRMFCEIVRDLGAVPNLEEVGRTLISRLREMVPYTEMSLTLLNESRDLFFRISDTGLTISRDSRLLDDIGKCVDRLSDAFFTDASTLGFSAVTGSANGVERTALVPIRTQAGTYGFLVIGCCPDCTCDSEEMRMVRLVLDQSGGVIKRSLDHEEAMISLQQKIESSSEFSGIIGKDSKMQIVYRLIEDIAPTDATVLIQGESGTGKELVAKAIHDGSNRNDRPFVVINCSAYPDTLLESELFGHEKGAFTGALRQKAGRFEQADGGTVFLDEVGEIPPQAQIKLLRVLQTRRFERLGGEQTVSVNIRVLAATNKDLLSEVQKGNFREDLFYRLNVIPVNLPPLRERRNDIPLLARHFLKVFEAEQGATNLRFSSEALRAMLDYSWPGNVRELVNSVEHAVVRAKGQIIEPHDLPLSVSKPSERPIAAHRVVPSLIENERT
ncbi:MAG: two-component system, NtrC family, response regulator HydG, partial [Thermodesulfobacteriota bacterium]|nr:two-component system, NtrC family, response regulator HydG [Thermodesulfobacteriota bacterium]